MMVSPEWFYEERIKGKSAEQIKKEIRSLRGTISHLRKAVANPGDYKEAWRIRPAPKVQLQMHILYLQKAEQALRETESK